MDNELLFHGEMVHGLDLSSVDRLVGSMHILFVCCLLACPRLIDAVRFTLQVRAFPRPCALVLAGIMGGLDKEEGELVREVFSVLASASLTLGDVA